MVTFPQVIPDSLISLSYLDLKFVLSNSIRAFLLVTLAYTMVSFPQVGSFSRQNGSSFRFCCGNVWQTYPDVWQTYHLPPFMCGRVTIYVWQTYPDVWQTYPDVWQTYPDVWRKHPNVWQTYHFDLVVR